MILYNRSKGTHFVYNPARNEFLRECQDVSWWTRTALGYDVIECKDIKDVNKYRKAVTELDVANLSVPEVLKLLMDKHPEWFI